MGRESYFDGGLLSYIGYSIIASLITILTLGICAPWGICIMINWKVKHTVIDGHRLYFDGTATQLLWQLDQMVNSNNHYTRYLLILV